MEHLHQFFKSQAKHCASTALGAFVLFLVGIAILGLMGFALLVAKDHLFHTSKAAVPMVLQIALCILTAIASSTLTEDLFDGSCSLYDNFTEVRLKLEHTNSHGIHISRSCLLLFLGLGLFLLLVVTSAIAWYGTHKLNDFFPALYDTHLGTQLVLGESTLAIFAAVDLVIFWWATFAMRRGILTTPAHE